MIDNQLPYYLVVSQKWQKRDSDYIQAWQDLPSRPRFVHLIRLLGHLMVKMGQYMQRIAEPSHQKPLIKQTNR